MPPPVARLALLPVVCIFPVGGPPSDVRLAGPLEADRLSMLPIPAAMPETARVRLELRAGDFSY